MRRYFYYFVVWDAAQGDNGLTESTKWANQSKGPENRQSFDVLNTQLD